MTRIFTRDADGATNRQRDRWLEQLRNEPRCAPTLLGILQCIALAISGAAFVYFTLHTI